MSRPSYLAGYAIVIGVALLGLFAPFLPLRSPLDADPQAYLLPPSLAHPMGTDLAGLDIFSRVLHALRVDLFIAIVSTLWAAAIGGSFGAIVGLWEGRSGIKGPVATLLILVSTLFLATMQWLHRRAERQRLTPAQ